MYAFNDVEMLAPSRSFSSLAGTFYFHRFIYTSFSILRLLHRIFKCIGVSHETLLVNALSFVRSFAFCIYSLALA